MSVSRFDNLNNDQSAAANLDWLAFQYVAGELSSEAALEFEARLETDEAACRAVARCVQLTDAIAAIEDPCQWKRDDIVPRPRRRWAATVAVVASAACLLWMVTTDVFMPRSLDGQSAVSDIVANPTAADSPIANRLVELWSGSSPQMIAADEFPLVAPIENLVDSELDSFLEPIDDVEGEFVVPGWMLAAVSEEDMPHMLDGEMLDGDNGPREN